MVTDGDRKAGIQGLSSLLVLAGLLAVAGILLPFVGIFLTLFLPLPMILLRLENQETVPSLILSGLVLAVPLVFVGRITPEIFFYTAMLFYGYIMGEGWRRGTGKETFVIWGLIAVLAAGTASMILLAFSRGTGPLVLINEHVSASLSLALEIYRDMGISEENLAHLESEMPQLEYALTRLLPAVSAQMLLLVAWLNLLVARPMARHRKINAPDLGLFMNWGVPPFFIWGFILAGILLLLPVAGIRILGISCLLLLMPLYFFQGMAILAFWFHHRAVPPFIRYALYALVLIQQMLVLLVLMVGIFDTWINFRKRIQTTTPKS